MKCGDASWFTSHPRKCLQWGRLDEHQYRECNWLRGFQSILIYLQSMKHTLGGGRMVRLVKFLASMQTWVQIPRTHAEFSQTMWFVTSALGRQRQEGPWSSRARQPTSVPLVGVWVLTMCAENVHHSLPTPDTYGLKIIPLQQWFLRRLAKPASLFNCV